MADATKNPFIESADVILKLLTIILGTLFVLGLLIQNLQLMELGIADFAAVQTRYVLTGCLFVAYVTVLFVVLIPTAFIPWRCWLCLKASSSAQSAFLRSLKIAGQLFFISACLVFFAGGIMGYASPSGRTWPSFYHYNVSQYPLDFIAVYKQFWSVYGNAKILYASASIVALLAIAIFFVKAGKTLADVLKLAEGMWGKPTTIAVFLFYCIVILFLLMFGYADEVYPNLKYNLGGGQPQIANLMLAGKKSEIAGLRIAGLSVQWIPCCEPDPPTAGAPPSARNVDSDEAASVPNIAIWYQSDKFLYIAGAKDQTKSRVVAVDLKLVSSIHYLAKYARVVSGGQIVELRNSRNATPPGAFGATLP